MTVVICDVCGCRLETRSKGNYGWFSAGGVVVLVGDRPARLLYRDKVVTEVCDNCVVKCRARAWMANDKVVMT